MSIFLSQDSDQQTDPIKRANFSDTANQWKIFDAYGSNEQNKESLEELDRLTSFFIKEPKVNRKQKTLKSNSKWGNMRKFSPKTPSNGPQSEAQDLLDKLTCKSFVKKTNYRRLLGEKKIDEAAVTNQRLLRKARILERMVTQDEYKEIALGWYFW